MIYCACLDVSLRTVNICVIDGQGELVAETKLASDVQDIIAYLDGLELDLAGVGLEAGTLTQYLTFGLQAAGVEVVCMKACPIAWLSKPSYQYLQQLTTISTDCEEKRDPRQDATKIVPYLLAP